MPRPLGRRSGSQIPTSTEFLKRAAQRAALWWLFRQAAEFIGVGLEFGRLSECTKQIAECGGFIVAFGNLSRQRARLHFRGEPPQGREE